MNLPCPCCGCRTLPSHGTFDICPVCFWEDDFTVDPEDDLNPNNMCLHDARANLAAWGAVDPELVHWTRPPRLEEAPEGTPHRGERPYDRWPTLPAGDGMRFGWIGPAAPVGEFRDGFLVLDDGRRAGLRIRADEDAAAARVQPAEHVGRDRDGQFDVWLAIEWLGTGEVLRALRAGVAADLAARLPAAEAPVRAEQAAPTSAPPDTLAPRPAAWAPSRQALDARRTYGGGGHGEVRWEASPDGADEVGAWARAQLESEVQPGDELAMLGPRSWVLRRRVPPAGLLVRGVAVHDAAALPPPGSPEELPAGTRCLLEWSSGTFPAPPDPTPPPPPRRRWGRR